MRYEGVPILPDILKGEGYDELDPPAVPPSRTFDPDDVVIPGFLPDIPEVRLEIAEYYNSVRRCDDTVRAEWSVWLHF